MTSESSMAPLLVLQNTRIHICTMNNGDKATDIETVVDEWFGCQTTLRILYINLYYHYIRSQEYLDNMQFRCDFSVVENMDWSYKCFYYFRIDRSVCFFYEIENTKYFQIWFWLWELSVLNVIDIYIIGFFDIVVDDVYIWRRSDSVGCNNETSVIGMNEVNN